MTKKGKNKLKLKKQRTDSWKEDRRGRWTGSQLKHLMSSGPGKYKLPWDDINRIFSFGEQALKYIYENAMERKTGRYVDMGDGTLAMKYGSKVEPLILNAAKKLIDKGKIKKVGFKPFPTMPNAGTSSDAILMHKKKTIASVELKACTNWGTHYDRTFNLTSEKSTDFWQTQGQMIAWDVDECIYVVAQPPSSIIEYVNYPGDIMELEDAWNKECQVSVEIIKRSKLHCDALLKRIAIAEAILNDWLATEDHMLDVYEKTIAHYEANPEQLDKYIPPLPFAKKKKSKKKSKSK